MDDKVKVENLNRAQRLASCGFECFADPATPSPDELRWAEFEFQVYCLATKHLAVKTPGAYVQSSTDICDEIRRQVAGLPLASDWNAQWEAALDLWCSKPASPHQAGHYVCPVIIQRVKSAFDADGKKTEVPDEFSSFDQVDQPNVWSLSRDDAGKHFFALDFSGMFAFDTGDPAFQGPGYEPPTGLMRPDGLHSKARCFMTALNWNPNNIYRATGVTVDPWIAMELLPSSLTDATRIRRDIQWRSLFRVVRSISENEPEGYFDGIQGYDRGNISIPLLHYTGPSKEHGGTELGGFLASLAIHDPALHERFQRFGLTNTAGSWSDTKGWGPAYECFSGRPGTINGRFIADAGISEVMPQPSEEERRFWRSPHFHYRITMLCRTQPALRDAMWRAAVQRVRNVAWEDLRGWGLPAALAKRMWLGKVLTSELALAIVVRLNVFNPGKSFGQPMIAIIKEAWNVAIRAGGADDVVQAKFEDEFCQRFQSIDKTPFPGSYVEKLAKWPVGKAHGRKFRLKVADLYDPAESLLAIPPLSKAVRSSPMFAGAVFQDPLENLEWSKGDPAASKHLTAATGRHIAHAKIANDVAAYTTAFKDMGVGVRLPEGHAVSPKQVSSIGDAALRQSTRETIGALTANYVLIGNAPVSNPWRHALRPVADADQRWASLRLWRMWDRKAASALRIGTDASTPPLPTNSRWQLFAPDLAQRTLHVFDQRESPVVNSIALASVDAGGEVIVSSGTTAECAITNASAEHFGVDITDPLQRSSFAVFVRAMREGMQLDAADDFSVSRDATNFTLRFSWLTQSFPRAGGKAAPSDFAFYLEYLGWLGSYVDKNQLGWSDGPFGRHLRVLGLDLWGTTWQGQGDFFKQKWTRDALPTGGARPTDLLPKTIARLWNPKTGAKTDSAELAATLLNWPSLYRMRAMLRTEPVARRALYDVWRMRVRGALGLILQGLKGAMSKIPRAYQLFQTSETLCALAHWVHVDASGLAKSMMDDSLRKRANTWFKKHLAIPSDHTQWNNIERCLFFREVLVPGAKDAALRTLLLDLAPLPAAADGVPYCSQLDEVFDIAGLASSGALATADVSRAIMLPVAAGGAVGVGVLAEVLPSAVVVLENASPLHASLQPHAAADDHYSVSGLVFSLPGVGAVPLFLPEPVEVLLGNVVQGGSFDMYWSRDGVVDKAYQYDQADFGNEFLLSADVSSWLGDLGDAIDLRVELEARNGAQNLELMAGLVLAAPWLSAPLELSAHVADIQGVSINNGALVWTVPIHQVVQGLDKIVPVPIDSKATLTLTVGLDSALAPTVRLRLEVDWLHLPLGSPAAILVIEDSGPLVIEVDLTGGKAHVELPPKVTLQLDLLLAVSDGALMRVVPTKGDKKAAFQIPLGTIDTTAIAALAGPGGGGAAVQPVRIDLTRADFPGVPVSLLRKGAPTLLAGSSRLLDVAEKWIAGATNDLVAELKNPNASLTLLGKPGRFGFLLSIDLAVGPLTAPLSFECSCPIVNDELDLRHGFSFALSTATIKLSRTKDSTLLFGLLAKLELPRTLEATLDFSGNADFLQFQLGAQPIALHVPAESGFAFDIDKLSLGHAGLNLHAKVREGSQSIGPLPSLDETLVVESAREGLGELTIDRGRLTGASLRARTRLKLFDDADGVLTVRLLSDNAGLGVLADLDVGVDRVFHIRALYLQMQVDSVRLGLSWNKDDRWKARGGLTGSVRFVPEGELTNRLAEYRELFDGISAHFENLDLRDLGKATVRVQVTPRKFEVAKILQVVWRGFVFLPPDAGRLSVQLLGDVAFTAELPGLQAQLSLGDITVSQRDARSLEPSVRISSVGIKLRLDGGFRFAGTLREYDDEQEFGIGGTVSLDCGFIPPADATLKLTRIRDDKGAIRPSIAVYGEIQRDDSLGYGFFLRRVGLGVGVGQGLRGFSDLQPADQSIAQRVQRAVDSPAGLPYPGSLDAWVPNLGGPQNLLVGYGLVSFGILPMDKDHPFVGSLVLAIDERLSIVAGLNAWFLASPEAAKTQEFLEHPAVKGALGFSPREQVLYARFVTLKDPRFGPSARGNALGSLLKDALNNCRLSAALYADPHGAIVEVGWPRQARFEADLGPARGMIEAGFRFGYYRGTHAVGLNLRAQAVLGGGFNGDLGFANVSVRAKASLELVASFGGAITSSGQLYALAELAVSAALELSVRVWKRIHVKTFFCSFDVTLFDVSTGITLTVTANLNTAFVPDGLGFEGTAKVSLHVAGFGFEVRVRVAASEGRIGEARRVINELMPPIDNLLDDGKTLRFRAKELALSAAGLVGPPPALPAWAAQAAVVSKPAPAVAAPPDQWRYFPIRVGDQLRVVLFPDGEAEACYPKPTKDNNGAFAERYHKWQLKAGAKHAWLGLVGRTSSTNVAAGFEVLEGARQELLPLDWVQKRDPDQSEPVLVGDLLMTLEDAQPKYVEVVDPRTLRPVDGDFDDPAVTAMPGRRSTRFRVRRGAGTYDWHLAQAARYAQKNPAPSAETVTHQGELLMQLLALARDTSALVDHEIPALIGDVPDGRRLAAQLGLVLAFNDPVHPDTGSGELEAEIAHAGMAALFESASLQLFDHPIAPDTILPPVNRDERYQIVPGYDFQGKGEIGIAWTVLRIKPDGTAVREGPYSHAGIESFRVRRVQTGGTQVPATPPVLLLPGWLTYPLANNHIVAVRPQFQFVDRGLPTLLHGEAKFEYIVEALSPGNGKALATQRVKASYFPASQPFTIQHAQVLLRLPSIAEKTEFVVQFDVAVSGLSDQDLKAPNFGSRLRLWRRDAESNMLGRYGDGLDLALNLSAGIAVEDADGLRVKLPQPDQMRQLAAEDLQALSEVQLKLDWTAVGGLKDGVQHFNARVSIDDKNEATLWNDILGTARAGEFHIYVKGDPNASQLNSPAFRLRHAIRFDPSDLSTVQDKSMVPENGLFSEGSEVSLLERVPIKAAKPAPRNYLPLEYSSFKAEVGRESFAPVTTPGAGTEARVVSRLRGVISPQPDSNNPLGPVVALRVWGRDTMDTDLPVRQIAQVTLQSEALFRSLPVSVTPRPLPGDAGALDWQPEGEKLQADWPPGGAVATEFSAIEDVNARPVLLHHSLIEAVGELDARALELHAIVCLSVDEPLLPSPAAVPQGERIERLLKRADATTDPAGWRLVEALGGSLTCWLERDGEPIDPSEWLDNGDPVDPQATLSKQDVAVLSFTRFAPGERPHGRARLQWCVRLFALPVLRELDGLRQKVDPKEVLRGGCLFQALQAIDPTPYDPKTGTATLPRRWEMLLITMGERAAHFLGGNNPSKCRLFWQAAPLRPAANPKGDTPVNAAIPPPPLEVDIPLLDGQVHFFHGLDEGYAQYLDVWVEVVRRYQFATEPFDPHAPSPRDVAHKVAVPRTLALAPDRWATGIDATTGALCALVTVHPAQRAQLARDDLGPRTQFVGQRVALRRRIDDADAEKWRDLLGRILSFDVIAWQASWATATQAASNLEDWSLPERGPERIVRGSDRYRYPHLPAAYRYAVAVSTQAGVRESREERQSVDDHWLTPVFVEGGDLAYAPPELTVVTAEDGQLHIEFPLVRAADSLDPTLWPTQQRRLQAVLSYWLRHDKPIGEEDGGDFDDGIPRMPMQLPDLYAAYVLVASNTKRQLTLELARINIKPGETKILSVSLLVEPYDTETAELGRIATAELVQITEGALAGRLSARITLDLACSELAWLRTLRDGDSPWTLQIAVERDGTRYGGRP
ncbi:hypothetical protein [Pseudomonas sp. FP1740]|uniref:hypothetical protein n=1 Tax=Pseudomonas sp. FP1740 TaxID=2954078 RepID=UPI00273637D2|nr:hypothetical protein [Pseudomonas sp. FP1740]WLG45010.1 hypothetical protein PSH69_29915 [Pseudomonas sp. FP1740]